MKPHEIEEQLRYVLRLLEHSARDYRHEASLILRRLAWELERARLLGVSP